MSTYKNLIGKPLKYLTTNLSNDAAEGQVWYNSTTGNFKDIIVGTAWASASPLVSGRNQTAAAGTQDASILFGGKEGPPPNADTGTTQEYNGSGWAMGGTMTDARYELGGAGTQTAGLAFGGIDGGSNTTATEEYGGTSWTNGGALTQATYEQGGAGTQTAALAFGGQRQPGIIENNTQKYDGSSWTNTGNLNESRRFIMGFGIQTAAVAAGGSSSPAPNTTATEEFDGSSWTTVNTLNTGRRNGGSSGILTAGLIYGGADSSPSNKTEEYNGTTWSVQSTLGTARYNHYGAGTDNTTALYAAGGPPSGLNIAEEYTRSLNVITAGAFASSPTLSYSVDANLASSGSLTSAVAAGGYNSPAGPGTVSYIANAATWNGTAWSNITDMPERRTNNNAVGDTAPAFYVFGGQNMPGPSTNSYLTTTHTWNGSSWGSGPALAESQSGGGAAGTPSAIVLVGGVNAPSSGSIDDNIQQYNGSSWTNSPVNYPTNISGNGCVGTQTAAVIFGGHAGGSPFPGSGVTTTNEWNGSSISSANAMVFGLLGCSGSGTQTAALSYGGRNTAGNKNAIGMIYDGTSWATQPSLAVARDYIAMGPMGSSTNCLAVAGSGGAQSLVEEFTGETTALNIKTITTS